MTASTEQERVSLPLDLVNDLLALCTPEDHELRERVKQAARQVQVVPQEWRKLAEDALKVIIYKGDYRSRDRRNHKLATIANLKHMLAAAPQPPEAESLMSEIRTSKPEAAPVQLQESISKVLEDCRSRAIDYATCPSPYNNTRMETAFQSLEHQVRQLLAAHAHGITQAKQGGKQP